MQEFGGIVKTKREMRDLEAVDVKQTIINESVRLS